MDMAFPPSLHLPPFIENVPIPFADVAVSPLARKYTLLPASIVGVDEPTDKTYHVFLLRLYSIEFIEKLTVRGSIASTNRGVSFISST